MNIGKLFLGLGLAAVFVFLAMIVGLGLRAWIGIDENIIWFIFGGCYFNVAQKMGL